MVIDVCKTSKSITAHRLHTLVISKICKLICLKLSVLLEGILGFVANQKNRKGIGDGLNFFCRLQT